MWAQRVVGVYNGFGLGTRASAEGTVTVKGGLAARRGDAPTVFER